MSNNIHGRKEVEEITVVWRNLAGVISDNVDQLNQYKQAATSLPSNYLDQLKQIKKANEEQEKAAKKAMAAQTKQIQSLQKQIKRLTNVRIQSNKKTSEEIVNSRELRKAADLEAKSKSKLVGLYGRLEGRMAKVGKEYRDLLIKQQANIRLTEEEERKLTTLGKKYDRYDTILKKVDSTMGKHNRNVGNYKSSFDGLGWSVAQLAREAPAFANSMQTGFMAISNNIPMLTDEINKLKKANVELAASGQPTESIFKKLGKAVFSWQTLISVGVTLLTVYGAKLYDWAFGMSEAEKATEEATKALEEQNKTIEKNIALIRRQLGEASVLLEKEREALLTALRAAGDSQRTGLVLIEIADKLNDIGIKNAEMLKNEEISQANRVVMAANMMAIQELDLKLQEERARLKDVEVAKQEILNNKEFDNARKKIELDKLGSESLEETLRLQGEKKRLSDDNVQLAREFVELTDEGNESLEKRIKLKAIDALTAEEIKEKWEKLQPLFEELFGSEFAEIVAPKLDMGDLPDLDPASLADKLFPKEALDLIQERFNAIAQMYNLDSSKFNFLFDDKENTLEDWADAGAEASKGMFNAFANDYTEDFNRLQDWGERALVFANGNAEAEQEIREQVAEKERALRQRQAEQQREQAIFGILVDTSAAVIKTFSQLGFPAGIPAAAAVGGLGLAQAALVASRDIPQFKDGVRGFEGGNAIVGDGGVSEIIRTPDGGLFKTPNKDTLVNLPKGSDVFKNEGEFERELQNMLNFNGILNERALPIIKIESNSLKADDFARGINELKTTIQNSDGGQIIFDEAGYKKFLTKQNTKKEILNNRFTFKGRSI